MKEGYSYFELIFFLMIVSILLTVLFNAIFEMQNEIRVVNALFDDCIEIQNEYETKGLIEIEDSFEKSYRTVEINGVDINLIKISKDNISVEFIQSISY